MRILGIDYGEKRIGLAVAELPVHVAVPLKVLEYSAKNFDAIAKICQEEKIKKIIIGLPITLAGEEGRMAMAARLFGERIRQKVNTPVEYQDERLTTKA